MAWAAVAGASAVIAGLAASAIALVGFGLDSATDGLASAVLVWRFRHERSGSHDVQLVERRAAKAVGTILILIGLYLTASAIGAIADHAAPESSTVGIILTVLSVLILPILGRAKLPLAASLHSTALRGDGILSVAGAAVATVTRTSLALESSVGWWWSDATAALLIAAFVVREGRVTSRSARDCASSS